MSFEVKSPKKLIEVALPLDAINIACAREKMPGIGAHPRGIHLWWARRPLAAARAIIFGQIVNDPSWKWDLENPGQIPPNHLKATWAASRKRLFTIIEDIVKWENTTNEEVMERAREEIRKSWREVCELNKDHPQADVLFNPKKLPALHDPFAGGGAIPLEAQRLGLEAYASDLNPVAVLINKAMIEIPPKFAGRAPVGPIPAAEQENKLDFKKNWPGATGLAEDVRRYGTWMREEAKKRIGYLYPPVEITKEIATDRPDLQTLIGQKATVLAWIWARTVKSPNPAFSHVDVPLSSNFILSSKSGKEAYIQPVITGDNYHFSVKIGIPPPSAKNGTKLSRGANFRCILSDIAIEPEYVKSEGRAGRMSAKLMAMVIEGPRGRIYIEPTIDAEAISKTADPSWKPDLELPNDLRNFWTPPYGVTHYHDLFTKRQLVALTTFSDLVIEAKEKIRNDILLAQPSELGAQNSLTKAEDDLPLDNGGVGATAYAEAVSIYLAFTISRLADFGCTIATWKPSGEQVMQLFKRQAIPMTWDFPESNFLGEKAICLLNAVKYTYEGLNSGVWQKSSFTGKVFQAAAQKQNISINKWISTDPPYYDNIGYADLSDFFYVWLRRALQPIFPNILSTIAVPKSEELVATPYRHGGKEKAEEFFLTGMSTVLRNLATQVHPEGPVTIYYAFKQAETSDENGTISAGWVTFLTAILNAGFAIVGTWPLRSEQEFRMIGMGTNALASSIVLVCRKRSTEAPTISRREFIRELNQVLPEALDEMTKGSGDDRSPVAPVDLSQAIIGPGIAVFSKYSAVLEADGSQMSIRTALQMINRFLAEDDFDPDTQFCLHWFDQYGWGDGVYGQADVLARAKSTSVSGLMDAGVVQSGSGVVRLRKWGEYPTDWDPSKDIRSPVWETLHHLIRALKQDGETAAGLLLSKLNDKAEAARQLAYRLYTLCERQGWAEDARAYNELITSWTGIEAATSVEVTIQKQTELEI